MFSTRTKNAWWNIGYSIRTDRTINIGFVISFPREVVTSIVDNHHFLNESHKKKDARESQHVDVRTSYLPQMSIILEVRAGVRGHSAKTRLGFVGLGELWSVDEVWAIK